MKTIEFDYDQGRLVVDDETLHCGDCVTVLYNGAPVSIRIETNIKDQWYSPQLPGVRLEGLEVLQ